MAEDKQTGRIAQFLFEVSTLRFITRSHRQTLFENDPSDNIASHSFNVAMIGFFLAKMEEVNWQKVMIMCLLHDLGEVRTGDHNWIHRRYVSEDDERVLEEQLGLLPFSELADMAREYRARQSSESIVAKDADILGQVVLLKEYEQKGNQEAKLWLAGKSRKRPYAYLDQVKTASGRALGMALYDERASSWWDNLYTHQRIGK